MYILAFPTIWLIVIGFAFLGIGVTLGLFFRDPNRTAGSGIVSPADGKVTRVEDRRGGWVFISIFMNVHNVHVNRAPWDGKFIDVVRHHGGFVPAFDKDSDRNERVVTRFQTDTGIWEITQIAGAVARRIVPYVSAGDGLRKGERFGLIRFGSRVDLLFRLPPGIKVIVVPGQKVLAGISNIAIHSPKRQNRGGTR